LGGGTDSSKRSPSIAAGGWLESQSKTVNGLAAGNALIARHHQIFASPPAYWLGNDLTIYNTGDEACATGNGLTDRVNVYGDYGGGIYVRPASTGYSLSGPSLVLGDSRTKKARICVLHDSIGMGSGENLAAPWKGWVQRLLQANYPWYMAGSQGYSLNTLLATTTERNRRLALLDLAGITHVLVQVISADVSTGTGQSAILMANLDNLQSYLNTLPLKPRLVVCTATPRTDSGNTTKYSTDSTYAQSERITLNAALRTQSKYAVLDVAFYAQSSTNNNLWDTTGGKGTTDGVTPNLTTHQAIAAGLAASVALAFNTSRYT
jgi:hypothetical protein